MLRCNSIGLNALFGARLVLALVFATALNAQDARVLHHRHIPVLGSHSPIPSPTAQQSSPLNPTTWTNIGPAPITADPTAEATPDSGRIVGIAPHPTLSNTIYVAAGGGGVWKTTDGGTTWTSLTDTKKRRLWAPSPSRRVIPR